MAGEELAPLLPTEEEGKEAEHRGSYSRGKLDLGDVERWAKLYQKKFFVVISASVAEPKSFLSARLHEAAILNCGSGSSSSSE
jgi:hypothetical protein